MQNICHLISGCKKSTFCNVFQVTYELKGFGAEKFKVDPVSGEISVGCGSEDESPPPRRRFGRVASCLDYETRKTYSLIYTATDGGGQVGYKSLSPQMNI